MSEPSFGDILWYSEKLDELRRQVHCYAHEIQLREVLNRERRRNVDLEERDIYTNPGKAPTE